jgi:hypothetical protein
LFRRLIPLGNTAFRETRGQPFHPDAGVTLAATATAKVNRRSILRSKDASRTGFRYSTTSNAASANRGDQRTIALLAPSHSRFSASNTGKPLSFTGTKL